jgi:parallel beta-helix repeat protein
MTRTQRSSARWALGVLLGLGAAVGPAEAVTLIQSCTPPFPIDEPGLYVLARDLNCPGDGIIITADNAVLNLNGHTLTGSGSGAGVRAEGTEANSTIEGLRVENGTVTGFIDGILLDNTPGARVTSVVAQGNAEGIVADGCAGCRFENNRANSNSVDGFDVTNGPGVQLRGNTANGNGDDGIEIDGISPSIVVEGNTANGNATDGFGGAGIDLDSGDVDNGRVRGNTTSNNNRNGIEVNFRATGNLLEGNRATGNANTDLVDFNLPQACVNTWRGNRFVTDNEGDGPGAGCIQ